MKKEQSHRETLSVSGDSATQNSLEKGVIKLKSFVCEPKTLPRDHNTFNLDDCEQAIIVALADQKAKILTILVDVLNYEAVTKQEKEIVCIIEEKIKERV